MKKVQTDEELVQIVEPVFDMYIAGRKLTYDKVKEKDFYPYFNKDEAGKTNKIPQSRFSRVLFLIKKKKEEAEKKLQKERKMSRAQSMTFTVDFQPSLPRFNFSRVGGLEKQKSEILQILSLGLNKKEIFKKINAKPVRGILLHGPSGCGKSLIAEAVIGELLKPGEESEFGNEDENAELPIFFYKIKPTDITSSIANVVTSSSMQADSKLKALFKQATDNSAKAPVVIFLDELDRVFNKKKASISKEGDQKILSQLTSFLDAISNDVEHDIFVIAATNQIEKIPKELRRSCRFSREISLGIPDRVGREKILKCLLKDIKCEQYMNTKEIAEQAEGYIGADLKSLVQEAVTISVERFLGEGDLSGEFGEGELDEACVTEDDFAKAMQIVQPSLRREGFTTTATVKFDAIGGLDEVQKELRTAVIDAIKYSDLFEEYGHKPGSGIILYGPPGCGKTLLARAVAHEAMHAAFISVKGPELLNKYLGESESAVRSVFRRARDSAPCIIFFDEIDALCPRRSDDSSNAAASRVVNQLLTEMDGVVERGQIFVIGATNRLELVDEAMLRPGRLDKKIEVPLPNEEGRLDILSKIIKGVDPSYVDESIDLSDIAKKSVGFSGAELGAIITESTEMAINETKAIADARGIGDIRLLPREERGKITQDFLNASYEKIKQTKVHH